MNHSIFHALVLNLHQPFGNLEALLDHNEWEAKEILWALDRIPRALWRHEDLARVHLSISGILLETLSNPTFQDRVYGIVKCGALLWHLQNTAIFDILGTAYYHPVLPLTPQANWEAHLQRWQGLARHLFWRERFSGFWPPEMGFCMEMIPLLKRLGYRYVLVDCQYIEPMEPMTWQEIRYRPHIAEYDGDEIIVVPRDRELSDAQEAGMEYGWFEHELHERTKWCDFVPLVTTCTDGDNGGWFRNTHPKGNFWHVFYDEFMHQIREGWTICRPIFIHEYLDQYGAKDSVTVKTGAWNTGWHHGADFLQWTGSQAQQDALHRVKAVSARFHGVRQQIDDPEQHSVLEDAYWHLLRAETSCNFYWGEAWVERCHADLNSVEARLTEIESLKKI